MIDMGSAVLPTLMVLAAAALGISGVVVALQRPSDIRKHLRMAVQLTLAAVLLFGGAALFLKNVQVILCAPVILLLVWLQYGIAVWQRGFFDRSSRRNRK